MIDDLVAMIRREVAHVISQHMRPTILVCTSYNPKTHSVKGIFQPSGVESGWVPLAAPQTNGGAGHFVGPKPGDAQKLDGDQFEVHFENGNPNTPIAKPIMSVPDNPPMVLAGEVLTMDEHGSSMYYKQDKSVVFTHGVKGGTHTWDSDGNHAVDTKGQKLNIATGGGAVMLDAGSGGVAIKGMVDINGA